MAARRSSASDTQILLAAIFTPYRAKRAAILHRSIDLGLDASYLKIAERAGINTRTLSRMLNTGRGVAPATMKLLANALECPIADLFEPINPPAIRVVEETGDLSAAAAGR
jgi:transcriptional regulator with XRE-family HTH domain